MDRNLNLVMFNFDGCLEFTALTDAQYRLLQWLVQQDAIVDWLE